jgi:DnaJ-class molecular chaperone
MSAENHYKTLEVPENASAEDIKKAYRRLSLKYHPDKNIGNPEVVKEFQKISAAFEVLGDAQKKAEYDGMKSNPFFRMNSMGGNGESPQFHNMDDLFANIFIPNLRWKRQDPTPNFQRRDCHLSSAIASPRATRSRS